MSKKSRVGNVDKNQTLIGSFFNPPAASSSAHVHLNGNDTTAANAKTPGQFNSAIQSLSVRPTLPLSEQITPHGAANSSVSRALDADLNEILQCIQTHHQAHKQNSNSPTTLDIGSFKVLFCYMHLSPFFFFFWFLHDCQSGKKDMARARQLPATKNATSDDDEPCTFKKPCCGIEYSSIIFSSKTASFVTDSCHYATPATVSKVGGGASSSKFDEISDDDKPMCEQPAVAAAATRASGQRHFSSNMTGVSSVPLEQVIPHNPNTTAAVNWLKKYAKHVLTCEGYDVDPQAHVVKSSQDSNTVLEVLGSYGVEDPDNCCTTTTLLGILQSVADCAGAAVPRVLFGDLVPVHTKLAKAFKEAKGSRFYNCPDVSNTALRSRANPKPSSSTKTFNARCRHFKHFPVGSAAAVWTLLI
jgi:hypothetical protein